MKMRMLAAMLIPFLAAANAGNNTNQQQMSVINRMSGNSQNGYGYNKTRCNRKKKSNRITMKKRLQIKHRKAA